MENGRLIDPKKINVELCREKLDPKNGFFWRNFDRTSVSFTSDAEISVCFKEAVADTASDMRYFLELFTWATNTEVRNYVDDPIIEGEKFIGRWRKAYVREMIVPISQSEKEHWIIVTLRQGLATKINWDEARIISRNTLPGNTSDDLPGAGTISADTASDNPERWLDILFPYFDPVYVEAAVTSLSDEYNTAGTIPAFTVDGTNFNGEWHKIFARVQKQEDGTCNVVVTMAQPQYTLQAFSDYGGDDAADVIYCWQVPKDIAQTILDAWKTGVGKSASASYSMRDGTVDLVLRKKTTTGGAITVTSLPLTCDTDLNMWMVWGYTSTQIDAWVLTHDDALTHEVRTIRITARGDGLYDGVITETGQDAQSSTNAAGWTYERLVPSYDRYGYTDTVFYFSGYSKANLEALALGAGVYGWVRAKMDENCTWHGEKVVRTYNSTPDTTSNSVTVADVDYLIRQIEWYGDLDRTKYRILTYEVHEWWTTSYQAAWAYVYISGDGGPYDFEADTLPSSDATRYPFEGSGVRLVTVGNRQYWHAIRVSAPRASVWQAVALMTGAFTTANNPNTKKLSEA
ncbi:MAG: hypothetical protein PHD04_02875 [Candidatus Pacebacteria bacterium]|nr:hypothetical protein [Candidatus Paceibacterota bacterium]